MKSTLYLRRISLLMLLITVTLSSCKKDKEDVAPDAATTVAGNYAYSEITFNGKTLPADQTNLKGSVGITRQTATQVTININLRSKSDNSEFIVENVDGIEVADLGNGSYGLRYDGEEFAQVKDEKIMIKGVDEDGVNFTITATK
ncbi:hypothetical protein [Persicitalea jodogahamensis]|uniref:Lipoprotein n=1 Tax=Persicitalea jodogahamensis TaxID=402147 RepID=A0A8J3D873_9BACT|nr:hypothetical protein [Persicitalea jodogahamensis]GHB75320.1 hypothetical protein GCM10007390_31320 [Persicitalea jodogahamensis]